MTLAKITDAIRYGIKKGELSPNQFNSFQWLEDNLTEELKEGFSLRWRESKSSANNALPIVKEFEGCKLTAYPDPETGNEPWTIGWGTTVYSDGKPVKKGDKISQELADQLLLKRLQKDEELLSKRIPDWNLLNVNQQAALISFTYNCGSSWFGSQGFRTLTKVIHERDYTKVPGALMLYVNPGGPSEAGLRRRRKAEGDLFNKRV
jgi:lysozyme